MKQVKLTRDLLLAMSIGDGYIEKNGAVAILHCSKQLDYLKWKHELLRGFVNEIRPKNNNGYESYLFVTKSNKFMKRIRNFLYKEEKITVKILHRVGVLGLSILYMDDGSLVAKRNKNGVVHAYDLKISLYLKSEDKAKQICDYVLNEYAIKFTLNRDKGRFSIRCGTREARKFIELVNPYVSQVPCMQYKLNISYPVGEYGGR
jgi:hypothetical protein